MLMRFIKRLLPEQKTETKNELRETSHRAKIAVERYADVSSALKEEIERNHFFKYLVYDHKGGKGA